MGEFPWGSDVEIDIWMMNSTLLLQMLGKKHPGKRNSMSQGHMVGESRNNQETEIMSSTVGAHRWMGNRGEINWGWRCSELWSLFPSYGGGRGEETRSGGNLTRFSFCKDAFGCFVKKFMWLREVRGYR